ncbi:aminoglycoside phosphotransferase family protein [Leifsonia shinshuensis]|uniref:Streptomycin 6-kinase n=1 Tax=Leifsonia shinshuensis TaxID=150026 RepID=A0A853D2K3_9MICO|nr:aminoglycoside phosphotransferase family protein [Leifsonia shinshuensis]NYJ25250.1 streptomycin 6-kinase [Leifsonia shinshuensis]
MRRDPEALLAPWRARWALSPDGAAFATPSSVLQPVTLDGRAAFLKLATGAEEAAGGRVLRWWAGRGAAPVLAADGDALVLARATGDRSLSALAASGPDGDDEATRILCRAALRLQRVDDRPRPEGLFDLTRWFAELFEHAAEQPYSHDGMFRRAEEEARALLAAPAGDVVLHGDVHHGNVLDFGTDGWLAIDPKHVHGDPAFDFANILCNPDPEVALAPGRFERTVAVIAEETGVDERRMLRWALAWAGLSAAWSERSGGDAGTTIGVGLRALQALEAPA